MLLILALNSIVLNFHQKRILDACAHATERQVIRQIYIMCLYGCYTDADDSGNSLIAIIERYNKFCYFRSDTPLDIHFAQKKG